MYKVHHDATLVPLNLDCGEYEYEGEKISSLSASASKDLNGMVHISIVNIHPEKDTRLTIDVRGMNITNVSGRILTSGDVSDHNTFDDPEIVKPAKFDQIKINKNEITGTIPAKSVVVLKIK
jgi:alpha-N-arabinofuranosidase